MACRKIVHRALTEKLQCVELSETYQSRADYQADIDQREHAKPVGVVCRDVDVDCTLEQNRLGELKCDGDRNQCKANQEQTASVGLQRSTNGALGARHTLCRGPPQRPFDCLRLVWTRSSWCIRAVRGLPGQPSLASTREASDCAGLFRACRQRKLVDQLRSVELGVDSALCEQVSMGSAFPPTCQDQEPQFDPRGEERQLDERRAAWFGPSSPCRGGQGFPLSVSASTDDSESSRMRMAGSVATARARATRCRWPPDKVIPRSPTTVSRPSGSASRSLVSPAVRRSCHHRFVCHLISSLSCRRITRSLAAKRNVLGDRRREQRTLLVARIRLCGAASLVLA